MSERDSSARRSSEEQLSDAAQPSSAPEREPASSEVAVTPDAQPAPAARSNLRLKVDDSEPTFDVDEPSQTSEPVAVDEDSETIPVAESSATLEQAPTLVLCEDDPGEEDNWPSPEPASMTTWARALIGQVLDGRYRVENVLGEGAMGVVYGGRHQVIDKQVAIKVLRQEMAGEREVTDRFAMEAKAASAVGSPHIVDTLDFGTLADGSTYSVMEYLEGRTLSAYLSSETLSVDRVIRIARQVAEGLGDAHEAGIVHRDLKPDNVFITRHGRDREFVKILDFGIAKIGSAQNKLTRAGAIFGTPHYMSPEQASGSPVDPRADIYALGVMLYEMATGRVPFDAEGPMAILAMHIHRQPTPPSALPSLPRPIPESLEAIILKCLAKQPDDRYSSMAEVVGDLDKVSGGLAPEALLELARRVSDQSRGLKRRLIRRPLLSSALFVVIAGAAVVAYAMTRPQVPPLAGTALRPHPALGQALQVIAGLSRESAEPAPLKGGYREVAVIVSPIDAEVREGDQNLGVMPVTLRLKEGEKKLIRVMREGYFQRNVDIDGSRARIVVRLVPVPGATPRRAVAGSIPEQKPAAAPAPPIAAKAPALTRADAGVGSIPAVAEGAQEKPKAEAEKPKAEAEKPKAEAEAEKPKAEAEKPNSQQPVQEPAEQKPAAQAPTAPGPE
jgi:serine/threonine-protein kinase